MAVYSPHTRGWTVAMADVLRGEMIFPAYAGLNLMCAISMRSSLDIPRIRGVEPGLDGYINGVCAYSPHTRGWTYVCHEIEKIDIIFPAYAGLNLLF